MMMRILFSALVLAGAVAAGYVSAPKASAQSGALVAMGLAEGETVRLVLDAERGVTHNCVVMGFRNDFLGCRVEGQGIGQTSTRWYNLRLIFRVDQNVGR